MPKKQNTGKVVIDPTLMPKIEVKLLCSTILDSVKAFYEDPQNCAEFEAWLAARNASA